MDAAPKNACKDAAEQLALCIEKSPCVARGGSIVECLQREIGDCEVRACCVGARRAARAPGRVPAVSTHPAHLLPVDAPTPLVHSPARFARRSTARGTSCAGGSSWTCARASGAKSSWTARTRSSTRVRVLITELTQEHRAPPWRLSQPAAPRRWPSAEGPALPQSLGAVSSLPWLLQCTHWHCIGLQSAQLQSGLRSGTASLAVTGRNCHGFHHGFPWHGG